jgi:Bacteriophage tail sheath protein
MSIGSAATDPSGRRIRLPGVYFEDRFPAPLSAPGLMTGVPAFIGFADPKPDVLEPGRLPAVVLDRWNPDEFKSLVRPAVEPNAPSFLPMAVRGFFANGGKRCVVVPAPPGSRTAGLLDVLQPGGPLEDRSDIDLICIPDAFSQLVDAGDIAHGGDDPYRVHAAALAHCEAMGDRFAILDTQDIGPSGAQGQDPVNEILDKASALRWSACGALYYPWIVSGRTRDERETVAPPSGSQEWRCLPRPKADDDHDPLEFGPPCGHVAGLIARIDARIGPQRSPANASLEGVVDTSAHLTADQYARLNDGGVNCLRRLPGRGVDVAGARTLSGHSALAYVSAARVVLGFRRWLEVGLRDLVFEPQTTMLWDRIRVRLTSRCLGLLRSGALAGPEPAQAFFVKCDSETNPPDEVELGRVVAHVGLAPSMPAEFIIVRIEHDPSGVTVTSLS